MVARTKKETPAIGVTRVGGGSDDIITPDFKRRRAGEKKRPHIKVEIEQVVDETSSVLKETNETKENKRSRRTRASTVADRVKTEACDSISTVKTENQLNETTDAIQGTEVKKEVSELFCTEVKQEYNDLIHADSKQDLDELIQAELKKDVEEKTMNPETEVNNPPNIFHLVDPSDVSDSAPANWHLIYNEIAAMRAKITTPVDTMGCERMPETITPNIRKNNPKLYRFQLLISLMLSSQTKDEVNYDAMVRLQTEFLNKGYKDGLCLQAILDASEADIDTYILKVGFHKRKASFIKKSCQLLVDNFDSDIPKTIDQIVTLPGVGPKMGFLLLQKGWNVNSGIGVDVHLHRLAQMWGWVPKSDKPETTRIELQKWLPQKYWADINPLLVGFGQTVCAPRAKNCDVCTLAHKGICRSSDKKLLKGPISDARLEKLKRQRGDLTALLY